MLAFAIYGTIKTMKDGETLIDRLAQRRAQAEGIVPVAPSQSDGELATPVAMAASPVATSANAPKRRADILRWVVALVVAFVGFALFSWVVVDQSAPEPKAIPTSVPMHKQVEVVPAATPAPKNEVPDSAMATPMVKPMVKPQQPPQVALAPAPSSPLPSPSSVTAQTTERPIPARVRAAGSAKNKSSETGRKSAIRTTVSPIPGFVEPPTEPGTLELATAPSVVSTIEVKQTRPAERAAALPVANVGCSALSGLEFQQCNVCNERTALVRGFCREQVRLAYCEGRYGRDTLCQLPGYAKGF